MDRANHNEDLSDEKVTSLFDALVGKNSKTETIETLELLAEGSRHSEHIREKLASPNILSILVGLIENDFFSSYKGISLAARCIGNACADNDEGRGNITAVGFKWATECLMTEILDDEGRMVVTKAMYNICADFEPAQQECYRAGFQYELIRFCGSQYARESEDISYPIDLLLWICGQKPSTEPELKENLAHDILTLIIDLPKINPVHTDIETFASCVEMLLIYLRDVKVQKQVIEENKLQNCLQVLESMESRISLLTSSDEEVEEDMKLILPLGTSLIWCLSDIAALPEFAVTYTIDSEPIKHCIEYIKKTGLTNDHESNPKAGDIALTAACQVVGNLIWKLSPDSYSQLVETEHLHRACFDHIIRSSTEKSSSELLHGLAGLLIQLTRPSRSIRELIAAEDNCLPALQRLSENELPLIKQDCIKLIKVLGKESPDNQGRFGQLAKDLLLSMQASNDMTAQLPEN